MIQIERTYTITLLDSNVINYTITSNRSCITINKASGSFNGTTKKIYVTYYVADLNCFTENTITIIVTNDKGCSNTFTDTLKNECNNLDVSIEQPDSNNLAFNAIVTGGKPPYLFNWVYGLPNQFSNNEPNTGFHTQNQLSLSWNHNPAGILPVGYKNPQGIKVIVKDANGCINDVTNYYTLTCEPFVASQSIAAQCFPLNDGNVRKFVITLTNSGCGNLVNNPLVITYANATQRSIPNNSYEITIPEFSTTSVVLPITVTNDKNVPSNTFNITVTKLGTCTIKPDCATGFTLNNYTNNSKTITFDNSLATIPNVIDFLTDYIDYDTFTFVADVNAGQVLTNPTTLTITNKGVATFNIATKTITYTKGTATVGNIPIKWKVKNECDIFSQDFTLNIDSVLSTAPAVSNITKTLFLGDISTTTVTSSNGVTISKFEVVSYPTINTVSTNNTSIVTYNPIQYSATPQVLTLKPVNQYGKVGNSFTITYTILSPGVANPLDTCSALTSYSLFSLLRANSYTTGGTWTTTSGLTITSNQVTIANPGIYNFTYTVTNPVDSSTKPVTTSINYISLSISNVDVTYDTSNTRKVKIETVGFTTSQLALIRYVNVNVISPVGTLPITNNIIDSIIGNFLFITINLTNADGTVKTDYTSVQAIIPSELNACTNSITGTYNKTPKLLSSTLTASVTVAATITKILEVVVSLTSTLTASVNIVASITKGQVVCNNGMDVVFVLDYTTSMYDEINDIKAQITAIKDTIIAESNNNYRLGLVLFDENRDTSTPYTSSTSYTSLPSAQKIVESGTYYLNNDPNGNQRYQYITAMEVMSTTNNGDSFTTQLNKINTNNMLLGTGANDPEPSDRALYHVAKTTTPITNSFRNNVAKLIILITDHPSSGNDDFNNSDDLDYINNTLTPLFVNNNLKLLLLATGNQTQLMNLVTASGGVYVNSFNPATIISTIQNICVGN